MLTSKSALALIATAFITTSFFALASSAALADIAVSANDGRMVLENGVAKVRPSPLPDTVSIIDLFRRRGKGHRRDTGAGQRGRSAAERGRSTG